MHCKDRCVCLNIVWFMLIKISFIEKVSLENSRINKKCILSKHQNCSSSPTNQWQPPDLPLATKKYVKFSRSPHLIWGRSLDHKDLGPPRAPPGRGASVCHMSRASPRGRNLARNLLELFVFSHEILWLNSLSKSALFYIVFLQSIPQHIQRGNTKHLVNFNIL